MTACLERQTRPSALHEPSHSTTMTRFMRLDRTYFPSQPNSFKTCSEAPWHVAPVIYLLVTAVMLMLVVRKQAKG